MYIIKHVSFQYAQNFVYLLQNLFLLWPLLFRFFNKQHKILFITRGRIPTNPNVDIQKFSTFLRYALTVWSVDRFGRTRKLVQFRLANCSKFACGARPSHLQATAFNYFVGL